MARNRDKPFNNPFTAIGKDLKKKIVKAKKDERRAAAEKFTKKKSVTVQDEPIDDAALFLAAVGDAERVSDERGAVERPLPPANAGDVPVYDEEAEALAELASLVDGTGVFDISDSDEFIEGCREDLDRRVLQKLKRGEYAFRRYVDLHGMTRDQARDAVEKFIVDARRGSQRCVLIVHGRGLNSKDNIPVLKVAVKAWLERGRIAKSVLAFCTARPHDGGAGAVYVLLRR